MWGDSPFVDSRDEDPSRVQLQGSGSDFKPMETSNENRKENATATVVLATAFRGKSSNAASPNHPIYDPLDRHKYNTDGMDSTKLFPLHDSDDDEQIEISFINEKKAALFLLNLMITRLVNTILQFVGNPEMLCVRDDSDDDGVSL